MAVIRCNVGKQVEPNREFNITRIEIHQMIGTMRGNVVQQLFSQIAVGVNQSDTVSEGDVLKNQIAQQGGFARASFSNDVDVLALVFGRYAK